MKQFFREESDARAYPAAFGRLRVETSPDWGMAGEDAPAAFGRLRVETDDLSPNQRREVPAAFGRLRVETLDVPAFWDMFDDQPPSGGCVLKPVIDHRNKAIQNPAAFGRLRVETAGLVLGRS